MKSLSCITLPTDPQPSLPAHTTHGLVDSHADGTRSAALGARGPKIQTIVDVIRCEFAKQGRTQDTGCHGIRPSQGWTPVHFAAYYNREAALLHFLQAGRSVEDCTETAETPLLVAVAAGHINIVSVLLSAGANVNAATFGEGETALHISIVSDRPDIMHVILAYNPNPNAQATLSRKTPLHYAAAKADAFPFVTALLDHGAAYDILDSEHCTAAATAIAHSNLKAAIAIESAACGDDRKLAKEKKMLLNQVSQEQNRAAMNKEQVTSLLEAACPSSSTGLIEVIKRGDVGLAEVFLQKGVDPNEPNAAGLRPIFLVLKSIGPYRIHMVRLLANYKVDVSVKSTDGLTVLQAALEKASEDNRGEVQTLFEILISQGADPHVRYLDGKTLLHRAVSSPVSNARLAHQLLINGVDANAVDNTGSSAIYYASTKPCVRVLLDNSANPSLRDKRGDTPLLAAIKRATKENELHHLEPLFKASELRVMDTDGKTALHVAAEKGHYCTVSLLLDRGASPTQLDLQRRTPLLLAARAHQWKVIPLLARRPGSNVRECDGDIKTALHHVVTSIPQPPSTWEDIATATASFCSRSRSLRKSEGQTPLISAVVALPEEGLSVIEALLEEQGNDRIAGSSNCAGHEDLKGFTALQRAVQLEKPKFVLALLKGGAPFGLREFAWAKKHSNTPKHKETLKVLAEHVYIRYIAGMIRMTGRIPQDWDQSNEPQQPYKFPLTELEEVLSLGLDPNALPTNRPGVRPSLLWVILNQTLADPPLPLDCLHDALTLVLRFKADANAVTTPRAPYFPVQAPQPQTPVRHPLTFLIEEHPTMDIAVVRALLNAGSNLTTPSPMYQGRYPLHSAAKANRLDIVEEFIKREANINPLDDMNQTPLFLAVEHEYTDMADLLLKNGASVNIRNCQRKTSLDLAEARGSEAVVHKLISAGAKLLDEEGRPVTSRQNSEDSVEQQQQQQQQVKDGERADGLPPAAELQEELRRFQQKSQGDLQERERLIRAKEAELQERERDLTQRTLGGDVVPQVQAYPQSTPPPLRQSPPPVVAPDADPRNLATAGRKQRRRGMNLSIHPGDARDTSRSPRPPFGQGNTPSISQRPSFGSSGVLGPGASRSTSGYATQRPSQCSSPAPNRRGSFVRPIQQPYAGPSGAPVQQHGYGSSDSLTVRSPAVANPAAIRPPSNGVLPPKGFQGAASPSRQPTAQHNLDPRQQASYFPSVSASQQTLTSFTITPAAALQSPLQPTAPDGTLFPPPTQPLTSRVSPLTQPTASSPSPHEHPNVSVNEVPTSPNDASTSPNPPPSSPRFRKPSFTNFFSSHLNRLKSPLKSPKDPKPPKDSSAKEDGIDTAENPPPTTRKPSANFLHATFRTRSKQNLFKSANSKRSEPGAKKDGKASKKSEESGKWESDSITSTDMDLLNGTITGLGPREGKNGPSNSKGSKNDINEGTRPPPPPNTTAPRLTSPIPDKPPRIDSGVGGAKERPRVLARTYKTLDPKASLLDYEDDGPGYLGRGRKPGRTAEELSDWLEFQSVLDRL